MATRRFPYPLSSPTSLSLRRLGCPFRSLYHSSFSAKKKNLEAQSTVHSTTITGAALKSASPRFPRLSMTFQRLCSCREHYFASTFFSLWCGQLDASSLFSQDGEKPEHTSAAISSLHQWNPSSQAGSPTLTLLLLREVTRARSSSQMVLRSFLPSGGQFFPSHGRSAELSVRSELVCQQPSHCS